MLTIRRCFLNFFRPFFTLVFIISIIVPPYSGVQAQTIDQVARVSQAAPIPGGENGSARPQKAPSNDSLDPSPTASDIATAAPVASEMPTDIATQPPVPTATVTPSATNTATVLPISTPTPTFSPTFTSTATNPPIATPTYTASPAPTDTATLPPTATLTPVSSLTLQGTSLSFNFSVAQDQAAPGDVVTYTIQVINNGQATVTGLSFSDILPQEFGQPNGGFGQGFNFDPLSNQLIWGDKSQNTLTSGQTLTLQYPAQIDTQTDGVQIIDSALLYADGLSQPLEAQAAPLIILTHDKQMTKLDAHGGKASGLGGKITVNLPGGDLPAARAIMVRDLSKGSQAGAAAAAGGGSGLTFSLELYDTQGAGSTPTATLTASTPALQPTGTPGPVQENDQVIPLKPLKAQFDQPVQLTISMAGIADLSKLGADQAPFLVTLDDASGTWVRMPIDTIDRKANAISTRISHFSTWGAGTGYSFPQNGTNVLTFDNAYPDLFTGRSRYSLPIWTPPGRNGMAPSLSLYYSSGDVDGLLGDVQSSWVGMGWNVDTTEIVRQITNGSCSPCGGGSYGYVNKFMLLFNGTGYALIPDGTTAGRYHTQSESFLYIQLHNDNLGNNTPAAQNAGGEWWEVVEKDGTRWRLGWNANSEQLGAMKGYPGAATGAWASLGYAGHASNVVAYRWRADQVTDTFGNRMTLSYYQETRLVAGTSTNYDRASYLDTITFTSHTSGTPAPGYSVVFVRESRPTPGDIPQSPSDWDNWDTLRLNHIETRYGSSVVRSYAMTYALRSYTDNGASWQTTALSTVTISGGGTSYPPTTFTYTDENNRASCSPACHVYPYPRLSSIANGLGGTATYTFGNDGRPNTSWYNWNVQSIAISDGVNASPMKTTYSYSGSCYNDPSAGWCNAGNVGELVGYSQTTETNKDFNGTTTLGITIHKTYTDQQKAGQEYELDQESDPGIILSQTSTTYTVVTAGLPSTGYFTYASAVDHSLLSGSSLTPVSHTEYTYDSSTGNLTNEKDYYSQTQYRQTVYSYVTNTTPSVWILDTLWDQLLKDASGTVISEKQSGYDGNLPGSGTPTQGALTLSRLVNGTQTIDTGYTHDSYGNITSTHAYASYGTTSSLPSSSSSDEVFSKTYDTSLDTYIISTTNPLPNQTTSMQYDYGQGLVTAMTDLNNNTTSTAYNGLGWVTSITYPGYSQPNVMYTYPTNSAPFAIKMDNWDETASVYRSAWEIFDGLFRVLQTQGPYQTTGSLVLSDTSYDALGRTYYSGQPRTYAGSGGTYYAPTWSSVPHSSTSYDALGRQTTLVYPDNSQESFIYAGLSTITTDRNNHVTIDQNDTFGRQVQVLEYTGSGTYNLYTTTNYSYDLRDLLTQVTDNSNNQTTLTYDGFGRKTGMADPDMGSWSYGYDVFGNLTSQTDARSCVTAVTYDMLNRPTGKSYSGPGACVSTPAVTYSYDSGTNGIGHKTGMSDGSGLTAWVYNALGQVVTNTQTVDGTPYTTSATNDAFGRPLTQTLPSSEVLTYGYNAMGALSSLSGTNTYLSNVDYSAAGQVTDEQLGNGIIQQSCYDTNTLRLLSLRAYPGSLQSCGTTPSNPKLNLSFTYQPNGNISQTVDATRNETTNFTYDELDRLLSANGPYNYTYSYDKLGDTTGKTFIPILASISTGNNFACALTNSGGLQCWGDNTYGEIGDGTTTQRLTPVAVSGLASGVTAVASGYNHTCALINGGGVECWGDNTYGELGDGTTTQRLTPVAVSGLSSGVIAITAGTKYTCALTSAGAVKCWGYNISGQLGDGTTTQRLIPVAVSGLGSGVTAIGAGASTTCALTSSGGVKCWGDNTYGEIGDGTTTQRLAPVAVSGLSSGVAAISVGTTHTCALKSNGGLQCWGDNTYGEIGDGTTTQRLTPTAVSGLTSGVIAVSAGVDQTCALTNANGVKCWGANSKGQVGDGTTSQRLAPVDVSGLTSGVVAVAAGSKYTCALITIGGLVKCWGWDNSGQLGNGVNSSSAIFLTPVSVSGISGGMSAVSAGLEHACVLMSWGEVRCWGDNSYGELGDGTTIQRLTPVSVSGLTSGMTAVSADGNYTCALTDGGGVKCWGDNTYGEIGDGTTTQRLTPVAVSGLTSGVTAIITGDNHTCALTSAGAVKCWGDNTYGEIGDGTTSQRLTPVTVSGLTSGVIAISAGNNFSCALTSAGAVKCWGYNNSGQLGDGTTTNRSTPVAVSGLTSGVMAVSSGYSHACALTNAHAVKCWGDNTYGAIGDGTTTQRHTPVAVSGLSSGVTAVSAGFGHTCAILSSGNVDCWGYNAYGEIGDGTTTNRLAPVAVSGVASGATAVSAGAGLTCGLISGVLECWGDNDAGEIGNGTAASYFTAVGSLFGINTTYTYGDSAHKHAATATNNGNSYVYDADGNMIQRVENGVTYTQAFDAENRMVSVTVGSQVTQYVYDGDGNMVKQIQPNNSYTITIGGIYEVNKDSGGNVLGSTTYYPAAGAMRVNGTLYYALRDQLNSASEELDASGASVGEQRYYPFGETRVATGSMFTDRLYTGQRAMVGIGLDFYNARYYDPSLGRFISPDTITPGGPQGLNRYSYVMNSPIDFSDPSGHNTCAAFVNGTCVHEVSDADQKLINENGSTTKSPSSSVVTTTPNTPGNGNGGKGNNGSSTCNWICQKESFIETVYNDSYPEVIDAIKKYGPLILEAPGILGVFIGDPQGAEDFEVDAENLIAEGDPVDGLQALIDDANQQYPKLAEKADQLHHIFPKYLGGDPDGPLVSLPPAYHQVITNAFRAAWAYGQEVPPLEEALKILQQIYGKFPLP